MTIMYVLVRICIWVLGFLVITYQRLLVWSCPSLSSSLRIVAIISWSCLCLFDTLVELHAMDEKKFNDFSMENEMYVY